MSPTIMIPIQCKGGRGKAVNPYNKVRDGQLISRWTDFDRAHPELPCFLPNGDKFMGEGEFDGEIIWQYYDVVRDCWDEGITSSAKDYKGCDTRQIYRIHPPREEKPEGAEQSVKAPKYERQTPYDVNIEDVLIEALEYMEDRQDADHDGERFVPNEEMKLATDISQALYQLERSERQSTREREALYTESEVREIAMLWGSPDGSAFDKWWEGTKLNKSLNKH